MSTPPDEQRLQAVRRRSTNELFDVPTEIDNTGRCIVLISDIEEAFDDKVKSIWKGRALVKSLKDEKMEP